MDTYKAVIPFLSNINQKWTKDVKLNTKMNIKWPAHKGYVDTLRDALANPASLKDYLDMAASKADQVHFDADQGGNPHAALDRKDELQHL